MSAALRVAILALVACALAAPVAQATDHYDRAFRWSGYRWSVRTTNQRADPGHNRWGDSRAHVRVRRDKTLRLNIVRGRSVDIVGPRTGYGRYRWVVDTDLSTADPFRVAAFFAHGRRGECDIEFSRWGEPLSTTAGSWVTWERRVRTGFGLYAVSPRPPYTLVLDWRVGETRFAVRDATGAVQLATTVPSAPPGRHTAPHISYWLYPGHGTQLSPYTKATVHPPLVVRSFHYHRRASTPGSARGRSTAPAPARG